MFKIGDKVEFIDKTEEGHPDSRTGDICTILARNTRYSEVILIVKTLDGTREYKAFETRFKKYIGNIWKGQKR